MFAETSCTDDDEQLLEESASGFICKQVPGHEDFACGAMMNEGGTGHGPGLRNDDIFLLQAALGTASDAAHVEQQAMVLDSAGAFEPAISAYRQAADLLAQAAKACPDGCAEKAAISRHAGELLGRMTYLSSLCEGANIAPAPVAEHVRRLRFQRGPHALDAVYLGPEGEEEVAVGANAASRSPFGVPADTDGAQSTASTAARRRQPTRVEQACSAAAIGGAVGIAVLHAPVCAVGLAAGAAYATTRKDGVGDAARTAGDLGWKAASRTKEFCDEHHVGEKAGNAIAGVRSIDEKYGLSDKAQAAAISSWKGLRSLDKKYKLSKKFGHGLGVVASGAASASVAAAGLASQVNSAPSSAKSSAR